jgi:malate permease and related proteins
MKNIMDIPLLLLPLVLPMVLGYVFRMLRIFDQKDSDTLRKFIVKVSVPFLIFQNLYKANIHSLGQIVPMASAYFLLTFLFTSTAYFLAPYVSPHYKKQNAFAFSIIMGNCAFLGWGVSYLFYGEQALTRAVFFTIPFWPTFLLFGFWLVHKRSHEKKNTPYVFRQLLIKNVSPLLLITAVSIAMNLFKVPIPVPAWNLIEQFASFTIPMILFLIGLSFEFKMPWANLKIVSIASFIRLIVGFGFGIIVLFFLRLLLPVDILSQKVILIQSGMPAATLGVFFIQFIDIDRELMSSIIAFSTLLSLLTIPFWFWVIDVVISI